MNTTPTQTPTKGLAILIKAPGISRRFVPREGETITILDKNGKEAWSIKVPAPNDDPGVIIYDVQIDLLTERDFGNFCQKTWNYGPADQPAPSAAAKPSPPVTLAKQISPPQEERGQRRGGTTRERGFSLSSPGGEGQG